MTRVTVLQGTVTRVTVLQGTLSRGGQVGAGEPSNNTTRPALDLAEEVGLEAAGGVVPAEPLAVPVPELQTVLSLPVLISEV